MDCICLPDQDWPNPYLLILLENPQNKGNTKFRILSVLAKARLQIDFVLWKSRIYTFIPTVKLLNVEKPAVR